MKLVLKGLLGFILLYIAEIVLAGIAVTIIAGFSSLPYVRLIFFEDGMLTMLVLNCLLYIVNLLRVIIISSRDVGYFIWFPTVIIDYIIIKLVYVMARSKPLSIGKEDFILFCIISLGFMLYGYAAGLKHKKQITTNSAS